MYAIGPIPRQKRTGRVIGTHQKIDRTARRHFARHILDLSFPSIEEILHFEGSRGPDAIKFKTPIQDKPSHFIDPANIDTTTSLLVLIRNHQSNLTKALVENDTVRASFEAAWLAHAVTDGLTPAHHEPYEEQVKELMRTEDRRQSLTGKVMMAGNGSKRQFVKNNWSYWGAKGIMTTHTLFEAGVAAAAKPLSFKVAAADNDDIHSLNSRGFEAIYVDMVKAINELGMYDRFKKEGWTTILARQTTKQLIPTIVHAVELAWLEAYTAAVKEKKL